MSHGLVRSALLLCASLALAAPSAVAPPLLLSDLARAVADSEDTLARLDFALIAIDEMAAAYRDEAERGYQGRASSDTASTAARWSSGTAGYAARLEELAERALVAEQIDIHVDAIGDVLLVVDGESVVLGGPRVAEPDLLAGVIVERFCRLQDCAWLLPASVPGEESAAALPPEPPLARVEWAFSDRGGAVCRTEDGFEFLFRDLADLAAKRRACALVVAEFRRIAQRLQQLRGQGVAVDLQRLAIAGLAEADGHRLTVNKHGAYTRLALPALARTQGLLRAGLLWLDAQRRGQRGSLRLSNAGATLSPVMSMAASGSATR